MTGILSTIYRLRTVLIGLALLASGISIAGDILLSPDSGLASLLRWVPLAAALVILLSFGLSMFGSRFIPTYETHTVRAPVRGRWLALNSPATKVPSHGLRAYGQAYAVDLVHEPLDADRPQFDQGPAMRPPEDFPAFGQPVFAMVDGTVVAVEGNRRDHRSRSRLWSVLFMFAEAIVRELGGPGAIVGNHVTIRTPEGVYALVAHLKQGSPRVKVGDNVRTGDHIADCGNTGNSSEPHVHAQLMDRRSLMLAQGIPMHFADVVIGAAPERRAGMPANEEHLVAS